MADAGDVSLLRSLGDFGLCVLLHLLLPLLPLVIERVLTDDVTSQSLTIAATMYAITIGVTSRVRPIFGLLLVASVFFSAAYGFLIVHHGAEATARELATGERLKTYAFWLIGPSLSCMLPNVLIDTF